MQKSHSRQKAKVDAYIHHVKFLKAEELIFNACGFKTMYLASPIKFIAKFSPVLNGEISRSRCCRPLEAFQKVASEASPYHP